MNKPLVAGDLPTGRILPGDEVARVCEPAEARFAQGSSPSAIG